MRLAVICGLDIRRWRGGERYAVELSNALIERGHSVTLFSRRQKQEAAKLPLTEIQSLSKASIVWFSSIEIPGSPEMVVVSPKLAGQLAQFDAIYSINISSVFNATLAVFSRLRGIRFVHGMHNPSPTLLRESPLSRSQFSRAFATYRSLYRQLFRMIPAVHVLRSDVAAELASLGYRGEVRAIPNFAYWAPPPVADSQGSDAFRVLWIGDLDIETKGVDLLCKVVDDTVGRESRVEFRIVGSRGDGRDRVVAMARSHKGAVDLKESVSEAELNELYRSSHLFLSTARVEGFPLTLLEAQAYGLPIVGLSIPGVQAVLADPACGWLQDPSHPEGMGKRIVEEAAAFFADPAGYNRRRRAIQSAVQAHFGKDRIVPEMESFLKPKTRRAGRSS